MVRPHRWGWGPAEDDFRALLKTDLSLARAAFEAIYEVVQRQRFGKPLGARHVTGDLTGCRSVRFDVPGRRPERYRIVYRLLPQDDTGDMVKFVAIGEREGHEVYRTARARMDQEDR